MGLVVATRIQDQLTQRLPILGDHPNPQTIDEEQDPRPDELSPEPDVVQPGVVTKRHHSGDVDLVPAQPEAARDREAPKRRRRLGPRSERLGGGPSCDRPVGPDGVVVGTEPIELCLERLDGAGRLLLGQEPLEGLWNRSTLPQVCGW